MEEYLCLNKNASLSHCVSFWIDCVSFGACDCASIWMRHCSIVSHSVRMIVSETGLPLSYSASFLKAIVIHFDCMIVSHFGNVIVSLCLILDGDCVSL